MSNLEQYLCQFRLFTKKILRNIMGYQLLVNKNLIKLNAPIKNINDLIAYGTF